MIADKITIANQFNTYFSSIGTKLASQIPANKGKSFKDYLHSPVNNVDFKFKLVDIENTVNIIDGLKTKYSCGHDGLCLRQIKYEISSSRTLIINQSLTTGIFPERLKIAKVIPIYKKDDVKMFENYRPISILPAISKILEKTIFNQLHCMIIFKTINYTVKINMDLEETTPQNMPPLSSLTVLYSTWTKAKFLSAFL